MRIEYVDGRKIKTYKELIVNNCEYKEYMKVKMQKEIEEKLKKLYI
jgi:hypothetical protein